MFTLNSLSLNMETPKDSRYPIASNKLESGTALIKLEGEIDIANSSIVIDTIYTELGKAAVSAVVVDVEQVSFMDVSGLGALLGGSNNAEANNKTLLLRNTVTEHSNIVQRLIELTDLTSIFHIDNPDLDKDH